MNPSGNYGPWVPVQIDCTKCTKCLYSGIDIAGGRGCACGGTEDIWECSVFHSFFCELKTALKRKSILLKPFLKDEQSLGDLWDNSKGFNVPLL
jgi:hypothetical protein